MSSRAVVVVLLALAITPMANAGQSPTEVLPHRAIALNVRALSPTLSMSDLFAETSNPQTEHRADGSIMVAAPPPSLLMARISTDGVIETACVHDAKAAHAFLHPEAKTTPTLTAAPGEK